MQDFISVVLELWSHELREEEKSSMILSTVRLFTPQRPNFIISITILFIQSSTPV